jgi:hypothetical protein
MSARRVFYSFYFKHDVSRAAIVREIGAVVGNLQESDDRWEVVQKGGDEAIQEWIDEQMVGISCLVVLIGQSTAGRKWVMYEISKAWELGIGIIGVHIHRLVDAQGRQSAKGVNPFELIVVNGMALAATVRTYDPPAATSEGAYGYIARHLKSWVEEAIATSVFPAITDANPPQPTST